MVLSGGGAKGAYEVGVMKALFEGQSPATDYKPLSPEVYTGTSVGALNAAFLASQVDVTAPVALTRLEELWRERIANTLEACGNGILRIRGLPFQGLDPGCIRHPLDDVRQLARDGVYFTNYFFRRGSNLLFGSGSLRTRVAETVDLTAIISREPLDDLVTQAIDIESLRASSKKLTIAATNWKNGKAQFFTKQEIIEKFGVKAVLASSAIPGIFDPVFLDGVPYVDGGLANNTPFRPAIRDGADDLHIVYLDPLIVDIPFPELPNTLDTSYRVYAMTLADRVNNDFINVRRVNQLLRLLKNEEEARSATSQQVLRIARSVGPFRQDERSYRTIEVHRYRPDSDLGGAAGILDFSAENIDHLIKLGYQKAVNHDCSASGCEVIKRPVRQGEAK
jgi:NTE family protein